MALPYKKWTDEDIKNRNTVEKGQYPFEIVGVELKETSGVDKDGRPKEKNQMLVLDFLFSDKNGVVRKQRDWIVFTEGMDWKLRHLANTTGLLDLYEAEKLDGSDLLRKKGYFELDVKDYVKDGLEQKINFVRDYVKRENILLDEPDLNDDIKF